MTLRTRLARAERLAALLPPPVQWQRRALTSEEAAAALLAAAVYGENEHLARCLASVVIVHPNDIPAVTDAVSAFLRELAGRYVLLGARAVREELTAGSDGLGEGQAAALVDKLRREVRPGMPHPLAPEHTLTAADFHDEVPPGPGGARELWQLPGRGGRLPVAVTAAGASVLEPAPAAPASLIPNTAEEDDSYG